MLIAELMPRFDLRTRHERVIATSPAQVFRASSTMTIGKLRRVRMLFYVRKTFPVIAGDPGREIVMALCGKFWAISGNILNVPTEDTKLFNCPGFYIGAVDKGQTRLITQTCIQVFGAS